MKLSEMAAPSYPLTGLELIPVLQGGGTDGNKGVPMFAQRTLPTGEVLKLRVPMLADLSATADADPGAGALRWNNAVPDSATVIYVNDADTSAVDLSAALAALTVGGFIYIQANSDSDRRDTFQKWQVSSIADGAGYTKITASLEASGGAFVAGETLEFSIQQPTPSIGSNRNIVSALTSNAGIVTVDCSLGDYFTLTPTEAVTGWNLTNVPAACNIAIILIQGATPYAVAMPAGVKWSGTAGAFSTAASKRDELNLLTVNAGGVWDAVLGKDFV